MFDNLFARRIINIEKALSFGFAQQENRLIYETEILDNLFLLQIIISPERFVDTKLIEKATGDEYVLHKTNAVGSFVGQVRCAVEAVLKQVVDNCFDTEIFKSPQTKELINYVRQKYGDELEFLWGKSPGNAIWRRKDTAKWYAAVLTLAKNKLGIDCEESAEIIDLRAEPQKIKELLLKSGYYPGWHMNKNHWYTIILDGSVETEMICRCIDESYRLAH